jgi:hypothetical protein
MKSFIIEFHVSLGKLDGPTHPFNIGTCGSNVHIFILGSCNILSFTNISLSMWEELWWQSARWIVSNFQVQTGITLEKLYGPGYTTYVHIFILGSRNILSFTNISLSMWETNDKVHGELSQNFKVQRSITGVKLNGLGYPTNVHIFIPFNILIWSCTH